jgi:NADH-quinone oxidoreductase subunit L
MPELSGPIQPVELASWLWLIPLFPLLGALLNASYATGLLRVGGEMPTEGASKGPPARRGLPSSTAARIAVGSVGLSAVTTLLYCGVLVGLPATERFLLQHVSRLVRVGTLDASVDLALDPLSATLASLVTVLGLLVAVHAAGSREREELGVRFFAFFGAFVSAMLVLLLADNALLALAGWQGVALAGAGMASSGAPSSSDAGGGARQATHGVVLQRGADVALVSGLALLFWGLGGAWDAHGEYQPDLSPRLVAAVVTAEGETTSSLPSGDRALKGKGYLTVTALPDALVYLDETRTPLVDAAGLPLRTPFRRHELPGGAHSVRVAPDDTFHRGDAKTPFVLQGGVLANYTIPRTAFGADREVGLALVGPTLRFREIRDQLVVADGRGNHPGRDVLTSRNLGGVGGLSLVTAACLLLALGAATKGAQVPLHAWLLATTRGPVAASAMIQGAGTVVAGVYLVARLGFVFSLSSTASAALATVGAATALYGAARAIKETDLLRLLTFCTMSQLGLAFVALGAAAGVATVAVFQVATHAIVVTCLLLAAGSILRGRTGDAKDGRADLRSLGGVDGKAMPVTAAAYRVGAMALSAAPIPLLAGFWSTRAVLEETYASGALPAALGKGAAAVAVVSMALGSFAIWRSYYLLFGGKRPKRPRPAAAETAIGGLWVLKVLGALAAVAGLVLGASARDVGGSAGPLIEGWLAPVFATVTSREAELGVGDRVGLLGLALAAAYGGWAMARRRHGEGLAPEARAEGTSAPRAEGTR